MQMKLRFATALCVGLMICGIGLAQTAQPPSSQTDQPPILNRSTPPPAANSPAAKSPAAPSPQTDQPPVLTHGAPASNSTAASLSSQPVVKTTKPATNAPPPIPAGTTLRVQLNTTLTDATNKTGDKFTGSIIDPVMSNGREILPKWSTVYGHIAFLKPSGRMFGKAQMRLVIDSIATPDGVVYPLDGTLEQAQGGVCAHASQVGKTKADDEGTITGCGKSKKKALEAAGIVGGMGAGVGASIGMGKVLECDYYGYCPPGGSGMGTDIMYGAGIGATTALVYSLFKHERHIVLVQGNLLTFIVDRTTMADKTPPAGTTASAGAN